MDRCGSEDFRVGIGGGGASVIAETIGRCLLRGDRDGSFSIGA